MPWDARVEVAYFCVHGTELLPDALLNTPSSGLSATFSPDFGGEGTRVRNFEKAHISRSAARREFFIDD